MFKKLFADSRCVAFLAVLLCFAVPDAFAYGEAPRGSQRLYTSSTTGQLVGSPAAACGASEAIARANSPGFTPGPGETPYQQFPGAPCSCSEANGLWTCSGSFRFGQQISSAAYIPFGDQGSYSDVADACPANSTANGGSCTCNPGHYPLGQGCSAYSCSEGVPSNAVFKLSGAGVSTGCAGADQGGSAGCTIQFDMRSKGADGQWYGSGGTTTGATCEPGGPNGASTPPLEPASPQCPAGQCPGTVNGASVCAPCAAQEAPGPSAGASAPGGAASAPSLGGNAPPGAVSSTTSNSCTASGSCTTTTNYYDANGNLIGSTSKETGRDSFCAENPGSPLCVKSSISGSCSAVSCTGDAIQCAIAREQAKRNCELWDAAPGGHPGVLAANGQRYPADHPIHLMEVTSMGQVIDTSNAMGAGAACPQDFNFSVAGASLSIPFSELCGSLEMLGNIVVAFSMLAAAAIMFRG